MFSFSRKPTPETPVVNTAPAKSQDPHPLDALTGGAFSASTSGERAARIREWLAGNPTPEQLQDVFKELSAKDKGAARPVREKLDEIRRAKGQEAMAAEWATKAQALLDAPRLNIADALAWQRDAAKAGAPLSKEPLAALKVQLADRVKAVEDLQTQVMVQREAAVLLAQRIEVLSTKGWQEAQAASQALRVDVPHWMAQADALVADARWSSVDARYPSLLDTARAQLQLVWDAFGAALAQAVAAAADPAAPLPPVPVWADELRVARGETLGEAPVGATPARAGKPKVAPAEREAQRARATEAVTEVLAKVEQEVGEGHGKASAGAAAALRNALKEHGRHIGAELDARVHAALTAAGELEGWQRWRADQLREELVNRAESLMQRTGKDGQPLPEPAAAFGGRKMQDVLRQLREQWKATDQGGIPNHALWKRFDAACNEAHKVVEAWLEKVRAESAEHRAQRLALIEEVRAWAAANASATDWKAFGRAVHQFSERWREAGHLSEKAFAELQPQWKDAIHAAALPLENAQKASTERRQALIEEARQLGAAPQLRIDAVKALQQRWQAEAQSVPLDRKHEQKLWDAFRKPIDEAFSRKGAERDKAAAQLSERDRVVLEAAKALEAANASGDGPKIRAAIAALEAALKGQAAARAVVAEHKAAEDSVAGGTPEAVTAPEVGAEPAADETTAAATPEEEGAAPASAPAAAPKPAPRPVVAMRGDDRPGMKKAEPAPAGRGGKFGDRREGGGRGAGRPGDNRFEPRGGERGARDGGRFGDRPFEDRGPRLGDAAFRAQRDALEHAQLALKKLAAQAHGEALTQLMTAWEQRSAETVPSQQELGRTVTAAVRGSWIQALAAAPQGDAAEALLRLEMAAEVPTPAAQLDARRALQLQLLTRRHDPSPAQTWGQDAAKVLASAHDAGNARRLQNVLKVLLRR